MINNMLNEIKNEIDVKVKDEDNEIVWILQITTIHFYELIS